MAPEVTKSSKETTIGDLRVNKMLTLLWLEFSAVYTKIKNSKRPPRYLLERCFYLATLLRNLLLPYSDKTKFLEEINLKNIDFFYQEISKILYEKGFIKTDILNKKSPVDLEEILPKIIKEIYQDCLKRGVDLLDQ